MYKFRNDFGMFTEGLWPEFSKFLNPKPIPIPIHQFGVSIMIVKIPTLYSLLSLYSLDPLSTFAEKNSLLRPL